MGKIYVEVDAGNRWVKASNGQRVIRFPHALRRLSVNDWNDVLGDAGSAAPGADYLEVYDGARGKSGAFYEVADTALLGFRQYEVGARRYQAGYYDVLVLKALTMLLNGDEFQDKGNIPEIIVTATHAPQDRPFRDKLISSLNGVRRVVNQGRVLFYDMVHVECVEEPVAGLLNYTLDPDGKPYRKADLWQVEGAVLILDVGSYTFSFAEADSRGVPVSKNSRSTTAGVDRTKDAFRMQTRRAYPDVFTNADTISDDMIEAAFTSRDRNGCYTLMGFGRPYDVTEQIMQSTAPLLGQIISTYKDDYRAGARYGTVILTGGGSGLLFHVLKEALAHENIHLADNIARIQYANVKGASKLRKMMVRKGYL